MLRKGDGIGDLQGIISKLDYLKTLGVDVVWLCPLYKSPNDDNGYDISNYRDIMDEFGMIADWEVLLQGLHDRDSRFGNDTVYHKESGKMLATLLHTLQGTPYIYQGEEIGMTNVKFASISDYKDIEIINMHEEYLAAGHAKEAIMNSVYIKGRDNGCTPMQWSGEPQAGFTTGTPWLAVNPNYTEINVEQALADPDSIFHYYRRLIELRKQHGIIVYGDYTLIAEENEQVFAYLRAWRRKTARDSEFLRRVRKLRSSGRACGS
ncbi:glycosidase [Paenibacillus forsythiae]|uniref:Glycosidase n=1 Tax=Paenibacillus forsythiae TaxID=365616 RepID=A0ABU3HCT7_9BACL|nr:glycosidase [Paenibacillus forsythiae]